VIGARGQHRRHQGVAAGGEQHEQGGPGPAGLAPKAPAQPQGFRRQGTAAHHEQVGPGGVPVPVEGADRGPVRDMISSLKGGCAIGPVRLSRRG
jgi:hypothetical protein